MKLGKSKGNCSGKGSCLEAPITHTHADINMIAIGSSFTFPFLACNYAMSLGPAH